jgi:hypothetical protein
MELAAAELEASAGLEITVNDPFLVRRGARLGDAVRPLPWVGATLAAGLYPNLQERDYTETTRGLVEQNQVMPDLSRIVGQYTLLAEITPVRTRSAPIGGALRLGVGAALLQTVDDYAILQREDEHRPDERQLHPGFAWSLAADALRGPLGLRLRCSQTWYREQVVGVRERRNPLFVGADVVVTKRPAGTP